MSTLDWLLDSDPSIRWQVLQDVTDAPADEVATERARVATEGWGAELLALQGENGYWDDGANRPGWAQEDRPFFDAWTATHFTLRSLAELGLPPESAEATRAIPLVREKVRWDHRGEPYFDGEVEPCINGLALANAAYFGESTVKLGEQLLSIQLRDGGWNCWAEDGSAVSSFDSTICVLEGLLAAELAGVSTAEMTEARLLAEEYLLERRLLWRRSNGRMISSRFTLLSSPTRWFYDILWALDYFRLARPDGDPRCADAIELLRDKRTDDGTWLQENYHEGPTFLRLDNGTGSPSRWITLRAMRVLSWWDAREKG